MVFPFEAPLVAGLAGPLAYRFRIILTSPCRRANVQLVVAREGPSSEPAMVALPCDTAWAGFFCSHGPLDGWSLGMIPPGMIPPPR